MGRSFVLFCLLTFCTGSRGNGDEPSGMANVDTGFAGKVLDAVVLRDRIRTGEFDYTLDILLPSDNLVRTRQEGTLLFDYDAGCQLHYYKIASRSESEKEDVIGLKKSPFHRGGVISRPDTTLVMLPDADHGFQIATPEKASFANVPFEFRSFGYAYYGDYMIKTPFERVLTGYLSWDAPPFSKLDGGQLNYKGGNIQFTLEPRKDLWITSLRNERPEYSVVDKKAVATGRKILDTGCEIKLEKVNGMWVPEKVTYQSSLAGTHHISMIWKSLNVQIPIERFDDAELVKLTEKVFRVCP